MDESSVYKEYGIELNGCSNSQVELKLYSATDDKEYVVTTELNGACSDSNPAGFSSLGRGEMNSDDLQVSTFKLSQNYPNPFNPSTMISFSLPSEGHVMINIYDITGRLVSTLVDGSLSSGYHQVSWDGTDMFNSSVSAGLYIYSLQAEGVSLTRKMVLMK